MSRSSGLVYHCALWPDPNNGLWVTGQRWTQSYEHSPQPSTFNYEWVTTWVDSKHPSLSILVTLWVEQITSFLLIFTFRHHYPHCQYANFNIITITVFCVLCDGDRWWRDAGWLPTEEPKV